MSSDESVKSCSTVSSTSYSKNEIETLSKRFLSPPKLSVHYKKKRKTQDALLSNAKRSNTESSSSVDNIHSSTFLKTTSSSSKSSFKPKAHRKISFSPIQKYYDASSGSETIYSPRFNKNEENFETIQPEMKTYESKDQFEQSKAPTTSSSKSSKSSFRPKAHRKISSSLFQKYCAASSGSETIFSPRFNKNDENLETLQPEMKTYESKDQLKQSNKLEADESSATSDEEILVESFSSLSTSPEEERTDFHDFSKKKPEHLVKKKGFKQIEKESIHLKQPKYTSISSMKKNQIFPKYYPLGWMAVYNVGRKVLDDFMFAEELTSHRPSTLLPYSKWKQMSKEGLLEKSPIRRNKEDIYSMPIEFTEQKKKISRKKNKQKSSKKEKNNYFTESSKKDIIQNEQIRKNVSSSNKTSGPQNLSDDFARGPTNTNISEKQETSGTSNNLKNRIQIISDIEFESSAKIYVPPEIWRQYRNIVKKYN